MNYIRQTQYPYKDEYGETWLDQDTIRILASPCEVCGRRTDRYDMILDMVFCGSQDCEEYHREVAERNQDVDGDKGSPLGE